MDALISAFGLTVADLAAVGLAAVPCGDRVNTLLRERQRRATHRYCPLVQLHKTAIALAST